MVQSTLIFLFLLIIITFVLQTSAENLNGIYVIDGCECTSPTEKCEPNGPFILDQQKSSFAVRYGVTQVGVGTSGNNRLDLFLNHNRCKGVWNAKSHVAELKCQHSPGIICATRLRCVSGSCLEDRASLVISSSATITTISAMSVISTLLLCLYY